MNIDFASATLEDLVGRGLGEKSAKKILGKRTKVKSLHELTKIRGIGNGKVKALRARGIRVFSTLERCVYRKNRGRYFECNLCNTKSIGTTFCKLCTNHVDAVDTQKLNKKCEEFKKMWDPLTEEIEAREEEKNEGKEQIKKKSKPSRFVFKPPENREPFVFVPQTLDGTKDDNAASPLAKESSR